MPVSHPPHPEECFNLTKDSVHVWHLDLTRTEDTRELIAILDTQERARSSRLRDTNDRTQFIMGHAFARILLGQYLRCSPETVHLRYGHNGKPYTIPADGAPDIRFNFSRSRGRAAFAFALGREIGVDIEELSHQIVLTDVITLALSQDELHSIRAYPESEQRAAFFSLWVRKEAFLKAKGSGLAISPRDIETPSNGGIFIKGEQQCGWRVHEIMLAPGCAAAVCIEGEKSGVIHIHEMESHTAMSLLFNLPAI